jgi:hypothetical protein
MTLEEMHRLAERTTMRRYERRKVIAHPDDPPETIEDRHIIVRDLSRVAARGDPPPTGS